MVGEVAGLEAQWILNSLHWPERLEGVEEVANWTQYLNSDLLLFEVLAGPVNKNIQN